MKQISTPLSYVIGVLIYMSVGYAFGQNTWQPLGPDDLNQPYFHGTNGTAVAIHPASGEAYLAYNAFGEQGGEGFVRKFNSATGLWENVGGTFSGSTTNWLNLKFNSAGTLYIGYQDYSNGSKATVKKFNPDSGAWEVLGVEGLSEGMAHSISMAVGPDDTVYLGYRDLTADNKITVKKFNGFSWINVGSAGFTATSAAQSSIAIGPDGMVYAGYTAYYSGIMKATVMKYNGTSWQIMGTPGFSAGGTTDPKVAVNPVTNIPYIAYYDFFDGYSAKVRKFNGTDWEYVGAAGLSESDADRIAFAISTDGTPFIGYNDGFDSNRATVKKFNGSTWETAGNSGFSLEAVYYTDIALSGNVPYMSFTDYKNGNKATLMKLNGAVWECLGGTQGISEEATYLPDDSPAKSNDLTITDDGTPYVGYIESTNDYVVSVKKFNVATQQWEFVGARGFTTGGSMLSMTSYQNTPYIAFADVTDPTTSPATVMKFNGVSWEVVGQAGFTTGSIYENDLAISPAGTPYFLFKDYNNLGKATVMKFNGTNWLNVGNAGFTSGEIYSPAITIASTGTPYVAFTVANPNNVRGIVRKFSGSWQTVGGPFSEDGADFIGLAEGPDGIIYVAYRNIAGYAVVKKFNGSEWETVGEEGFSENMVAEVSLSIKPDGQLYVSYSDMENDWRATVMRYNGVAWVPAGSPGISAGSASYLGMEITPDGQYAMITYSSPCVYVRAFDITCNTTAPVASGQAFCGGDTVSSLVAEGENIRWYTAGHFGNPLTGDTPLVSGTYYVAQMQDDCEGPRLAVEIAIGTDAPVLSEQSLCSGATVSDLLGQNQNLQLYLSEISTETLAGDTLLSSATYYATQTQNGCESSRVAVDIVINSTDEPQGDSSQIVIVSNATEATLADLIVEGEEIRWYDSERNALTTDTQLQTGSTYYATQTLNGCESDVLAVTAEVLLNSVHYDALGIEYYPNPVTGSLHIVSAANILKIEVYTLYGQKIADHEWNINAADLDMSNLAGSTYLVRVYTDSGDKAFKVVKE